MVMSLEFKKTISMKNLKFWHLAIFGLLIGLLTFSPFNASSAKPAVNTKPEPIHVIGRMSVNLNVQERAEYEQLTKLLFEKTNLIDHPILYTCNEDITSSGTFVWDEIWTSKAALDKHLASTHFKSWWSWVEPHLSGPLQVLYVDQSKLKKV